MPFRYVSVPSAIIHLQNPDTKEPLTDALAKVDFERFLGMLMHNPIWGATFGGIKAQLAIWHAWEKCKAEREIGRVLVLAEEDWEKLKQATETPVPNGYGYAPAVLRQFIAFPTAVLDASVTEPSAKLTDPVPAAAAG